MQTKMHTSLILALLLMGGIAGCATRSGGRTVGQLEHQLSHAIDVFIQQSSLPNSSGREPGFDVEAHQKLLARQWKATTKDFHSSEGVSFLESRIGSESDDLAILGILKILHESGEPEAQEIFQKFAQHHSPVVAQRASEYLATDKRPASKD